MQDIQSMLPYITLLSTANFLALNKVQCSMWQTHARSFQTVGAGTCGFRTGTTALRKNSGFRSWLLGFIYLLNLLS